jgi:hypothetical protein
MPESTGPRTPHAPGTPLGDHGYSPMDRRRLTQSGGRASPTKRKHIRQADKAASRGNTNEVAPVAPDPHPPPEEQPLAALDRGCRCVQADACGGGVGGGGALLRTTPHGKDPNRPGIIRSGLGKDGSGRRRRRNSGRHRFLPNSSPTPAGKKE